MKRSLASLHDAFASERNTSIALVIIATLLALYMLGLVERTDWAT